LFSVNTHGTVEVLTAARIAGVQKVIFTSSAAVYGNCAPGRESDRCHPVTIYGASKLAAEEACRGFIELGLDVTILRLFTVWGEGGHSAVERFRSDSQPAIHGDGSQSRDFVHVDDVVSALLAAYTWEPGVYNIGTGVETSILGLWRLLRSDEPVFAPWRPQDILRSFADITKVTSTTTWRPRRLLHEELAR
jgi:UDP-glucose 4-epimerase